MGSEYFINSQELENKVRNLLPSQGGAGAGFDLSASTQIIPIIDLTESAEGSNIRQDLQSSLSFGSATAFNVTNATTTQINNTGYWRVIGTSNVISNAGGSFTQIFANNGSTDKQIFVHDVPPSSTVMLQSINFDFIVFLEAGHSLKLKSYSTNSNISGSTRQIASIDGTLVYP